MTDCYRESLGNHNYLKHNILRKDSNWFHQGSKLFQTTELPVVSTIHNQYPSRYVRLIMYAHYQYSSLSFILHKLLKTKHDPRRIFKLTRWVLLVRLSKVKILTSFEVNIPAVGFPWVCWWYYWLSDHKFRLVASHIYTHLIITPSIY